eukprot:7453683-Alexandrium_andersonii.AAC.1
MKNVVEPVQGAIACCGPPLSRQLSCIMETCPSLPVTIDKRRLDEESRSGPPGTSEGPHVPCRGRKSIGCRSGTTPCPC